MPYGFAIIVGVVLIPIALWFVVDGVRRVRRNRDATNTLVGTIALAEASVGLSLIGGYAMAWLGMLGVVPYA
jgi:hypothetical protein